MSSEQDLVDNIELDKLDEEIDESETILKNTENVDEIKLDQPNNITPDMTQKLMESLKQMPRKDLMNLMKSLNKTVPNMDFTTMSDSNVKTAREKLKNRLNLLHQKRKTVYAKNLNMKKQDDMKKQEQNIQEDVNTLHVEQNNQENVNILPTEQNNQEGSDIQKSNKSSTEKMSKAQKRRLQKKTKKSYNAEKKQSENTISDEHSNY